MRGPSDVIVVGGGAAGAVLARRLADDPGLRVTLLEAGPTDENRPEILQLRNWATLLLDRPEISVPYPVEPQPAANSSLAHSRARVLGGCSSHNACIALRAPDADLQAWARVAGGGWGPAGTAPAWDRVFDTVAVHTAASANPLAAAVVEAGLGIGLPFIGEWGRERPSGIGWLPLNAEGGRRQSSSVAYLHPLASLPDNLTVLTDTPAQRIILDDGGRATAVQTAHGTIAARREIVLCAGALETPKLLMLSGIGPAGELRRHGIAVRVELAGVGAHLLDHPETSITWTAAREVGPEADQFWEVAVFAPTERGPVMAHVGTAPFVPPGYPLPVQGLTITPNVALSRSAGRIGLRSADPTELPRVDPAYLTDPAGDDLAVLVAGLRLARRLAVAEPLAGWLAEEVAPGPAAESDRELEAYVRATLGTVHHPSGTARMGGSSDPGAVVDPRLRVRGVTGLRVADASIFPALPGVNPCLTCMMVGERAAEIIAAELAADIAVGER